MLENKMKPLREIFDKYKKILANNNLTEEEEENITQQVLTEVFQSVFDLGETEGD